MQTRVSIIVAIDDKRGIGKSGDLLFKIPEDFRRMKTLSIGHPIVMGRKTFLSIGRVLPKRTNIVITRDKNFYHEGVVVAHSLEHALQMGREEEELKPEEERHEVFLFGGAQIFKESLEKGFVDRIYLTVVKGDYGADTFFPDYEELGFHEVEKEEREADGFNYTFLTLDKK